MIEVQISDPVAMLAALRKARHQLSIRVVQLSSCRICGQDQASFEQAVEQLRQLEQQLEGEHVQAVGT